MGIAAHGMGVRLARAREIGMKGSKETTELAGVTDRNSAEPE
jgi:hypothetical protein